MAVTTNHALTGHRYYYVPTLKTKVGEATALYRLDPTMKRRTFPIFRITPSLASSFPANLVTAWTGCPAALDGTDETHIAGTPATFSALFHLLGRGSIPIIPVINLDAMPLYLGSVAAVMNSYAPGLVLRVPVTGLSVAQGWLASQGWTPANTDLLIDCGHLADVNLQFAEAGVRTMLAAASATLHIWRSVTLTASAAPKDASSLSYGPNLIPRKDWMLWQAINIPFPMLNFGDYGVSHRDLSEPPGPAMALATVTARYTLDQDWLIRKGRRTTGHSGIPMSVQYLDHARNLSVHPGFGGVPGCWGDGEISAIAVSVPKRTAGSRTTWASYTISRHISKACSQLP
jgi:hypothetical protein